MGNIIISIIMPIHNGGIYLKETLESIFSQNFQKFELICVDDASDEEQTKETLSLFKNKHKNLRIIELQKRVGAAQARNIGFSEAQGDYVIFLDADDIFVNDMLDEMYQCICENEADVCVCGYEEFYIKDGKKHLGWKYIPNTHRVFCENREDWFLDISTTPWNKLCKARFLRENNIYFQSLSCCNDVFFSCMVMINTTKRCYIPDRPLVFYRVNTETQISANRNPVNLYKAIMLLNNTKSKIVASEKVLQWSSFFMLWSGVAELRRSNNEIFKRQFYQLLADFFNTNKIQFHNKVLSACLENIKNLPYENNWFYKAEDYLGQLKLTEVYLKEEIDMAQPLFLWGLGKRGNAFQQFCNERNIYLQGVTDIKNIDIGGTTEFGYKVVNTDYTLKSNGLIIASNKKIYEYLVEKKGNFEVLNLEDFCPI